jgi:hypothetical protein
MAHLAAPGRGMNRPSTFDGRREMPLSEQPFGGPPPSFHFEPGKAPADMTSKNLDILRQNPQVQDLLQKWEPLMGAPAHAWKLPYEDMAIQHGTLPEAYEGNNNLLREVVISQVRKGDDWLYKVAAPLRDSQGKMYYQWDKIIYDDTMLDRLAEEGIARLMTYHREIQSDQLQRWGGALLVNSVHLETPAGREEFAMKLKQMQHGVHVTVAFGVAHHLLAHEPYEDRNNKYNTSPGTTFLDNEMREMCSNFGRLPKSATAAEDLISYCDDVFDRRGVTPGDLFIWPKGAKRYCSYQPYYMTGKTCDANGENMISSISRPLRHEESRGFPVGNHNPNEDPHFRQRTIGGFFYFNNENISDVPMEDSMTANLDRTIYSETTDGWRRIPYKVVRRYDGLFFRSVTTGTDSGNNNTITDFGKAFFANLAQQLGIGRSHEDLTWGRFVPAYLGLDGNDGTEAYTEIVQKLTHDLNNSNKKSRMRYELLDIVSKNSNFIHGLLPNDIVLDIPGDQQGNNNNKRGDLGRGVNEYGIIDPSSFQDPNQLATTTPRSSSSSSSSSTGKNIAKPVSNDAETLLELLGKKLAKEDARPITEEEIDNWLVNYASVQSDEFWDFQARHDGYQYAGFVCFRPYATYVMGSGIMMHANGGCAFTAIGHQKFRVGTDAARDLVFGQYTMYHKTMVHDKSRIMIVPDIISHGYEGGNGHEFWNPTDSFNDVDDYQSNNLTKDIFVCNVPINWRPKKNYMDLTGAHHPDIESLSAGAEDATAASIRELHYPTAALYSQLWGWRTADQQPLDKKFFYDHAHSPKFNTTCFQQMQWQFQYNPGSKSGRLSDFVTEKGPWGENVYEGCGRVRNGTEKFFRVPTYIGTKTLALTST